VPQTHSERTAAELREMILAAQRRQYR
jgi:hypothetical protein